MRNLGLVWLVAVTLLSAQHATARSVRQYWGICFMALEARRRVVYSITPGIRHNKSPEPCNVPTRLFHDTLTRHAFSRFSLPSGWSRARASGRSSSASASLSTSTTPAGSTAVGTARAVVSRGARWNLVRCLGTHWPARPRRSPACCT